MISTDINTKIINDKKTLKEWFDVLPEEIRIKAINNTKEWCKNNNKSYDKEIKIKESTLRDALYVAFIFEASNEGIDFWIRICREYSEITKEPFLQKL